MGARPGDRIDYEITYLEMSERPADPAPRWPAAPEARLVAARRPPPGYFLYLYRAVGDPWQWTDWLGRPEAEVAAFVGDPAVSLHTLMVDGWPGGFFMLDGRLPGTCDVAYFGLVPQATGRGLGPPLLAAAIGLGWARPGVGRLTVNTCTLDHPKALGLYRRMGFVPVGQRRASRPAGAPAAPA